MSNLLWHKSNLKANQSVIIDLMISHRQMCCKDLLAYLSANILFLTRMESRELREGHERKVRI